MMSLFWMKIQMVSNRLCKSQSKCLQLLLIQFGRRIAKFTGCMLDTVSRFSCENFNRKRKKVFTIYFYVYPWHWGWRTLHMGLGTAEKWFQLNPNSLVLSLCVEICMQVLSYYHWFKKYIVRTVSHYVAASLVLLWQLWRLLSVSVITSQSIRIQNV